MALCRNNTSFDKASEALMKLAPILAGITIAMWTAPARAWDDQGHMMVATVAWEKLNPAVKKRAIELLKLNPDYETFIAGVPSECKIRSHLSARQLGPT
jgi:hypothetical protein